MKNSQQTIANRYIKPFATISKLSLGLIILCFIAYSEFFAQNDEPEMKEQSKQDMMNSVSLVNGKYTVDTALIWSDRNKNRLLDALALENLEEKKSVVEIPMFIKAFLDSISPGRSFNMTNPDAAWCTGDIKDFVFTNIYEAGKQGGNCLLSCGNKEAWDKQLIYFGMGKNIALLSYYVGGQSRSQCTALIRFKEEKVIDFWFNNDGFKLWSKKNEIIRSIKSHDGC